MASWTFLTTHARTLLYIARHPDARLRDIAASLDITERTVIAITKDLTEEGYLTKYREGRRNRYEISHDVLIRDLSDDQPTIGQLIRALSDVDPSADAQGAS